MSRRAKTSGTSLPDDWQTAEYGSHWPVLLALLWWFPIRHVLECGSGLYSTNLFLDHGVDLVSVENNREWAKSDHPRHTMNSVKGPVHKHLPDLGAFDLVFIDDDPVDERAKTIRKVLRQPHPTVVVHDADYHEYQDAIAKHGPFLYTKRKPWTAVIWP